MPKIPRDITGKTLSALLERKFGYQIERKTGSHLRLVTQYKGKRHKITIPDHNPIKIGTLNHILNDLSAYLGIDKGRLIEALFGN